MRGKVGAAALFFAALIAFGSQTALAIGSIELQVQRMKKRPLIVVDAGHGGEDGGAVGTAGTLEKTINLQIAHCLQAYLEQEGFRVVMTREEDESIGDASLTTVAQRKRSDTKKRVEIVQGAGECLLVSIHQNFFSESRYDGAQVFYSANRPESAVLAEAIRSSIVERLQPENHRQNKEDNGSIYLLKNSPVPAVLVECGFLSNPPEEEKLGEAEYQQKMAAAIGEGILSYCEELEKTEEPDEK